MSAIASRPDSWWLEIESQDEQNALRSAQANLVAAQARAAQAASNFDRQQSLLAARAASRAQFEQAQQEQETSRAQIDIAQAQLKAAEDRVSYTTLNADAAGVVTATAAEPGEVVQAGQLIVRVALSGGRDAVFDVPGELLRSAPSDGLITVSLTDAPGVTATGRVREISPQADPITGTFEVRVGLIDPPADMRLGSIVAGRVKLDATPGNRDSRFRADRVRSPARRLDRRPVGLHRRYPKRRAVAPERRVGCHFQRSGVRRHRGDRGRPGAPPGQKVRLLGSPK